MERSNHANKSTDDMKIQIDSPRLNSSAVSSNFASAGLTLPKPRKAVTRPSTVRGSRKINNSMFV